MVEFSRVRFCWVQGWEELCLLPLRVAVLWSVNLVYTAPAGASLNYMVGCEEGVLASGAACDVC